MWVNNGMRGIVSPGRQNEEQTMGQKSIMGYPVSAYRFDYSKIDIVLLINREQASTSVALSISLQSRQPHP